MRANKELRACVGGRGLFVWSWGIEVYLRTRPPFMMRLWNLTLSVLLENPTPSKL